MNENKENYDLVQEQIVETLNLVSKFMDAKKSGQLIEVVDDSLYELNSAKLNIMSILPRKALIEDKPDDAKNLNSICLCVFERVWLHSNIFEGSREQPSVKLLDQIVQAGDRDEMLTIARQNKENIDESFYELLQNFNGFLTATPREDLATLLSFVAISLQLEKGLNVQDNESIDSPIVIDLAQEKIKDDPDRLQTVIPYRFTPEKITIEYLTQIFTSILAQCNSYRDCTNVTIAGITNLISMLYGSHFASSLGDPIVTEFRMEHLSFIAQLMAINHPKNKQLQDIIQNFVEHADRIGVESVVSILQTFINKLTNSPDLDNISSLSKSDWIGIECPNCKEYVCAVAWEYIHTGTDEWLSDLLVEGTLNLAICPTCGFFGYLPIPVLYVMPNQEIVIYAGIEDNADLCQDASDKMNEYQNYIHTLTTDSLPNFIVQPVVGLAALAQLEVAQRQNTLHYVKAVANQDGDSTNIFYNALGVFLRNLGEHETAARVLTQGIELYPHDEDIAFNLAGALVEIQEFDKAEEILEKLQESDRANRILMLQHQGMLFNHPTGLLPWCVKAKLIKGNEFSDKNLTKPIRNLIEEWSIVQKNYPELVEPHFRLANLYEMINDDKAAKFHYIKVLELDIFNEQGFTGFAENSLFDVAQRTIE